MKRYLALILALVAVSSLFVGCRSKGNVSEDENGMIRDPAEDSSAVSTTEEERPSTQNTPETATTERPSTENSESNSSSLLPDGETDSSGENRSLPGSRRSMPRF